MPTETESDLFPNVGDIRPGEEPIYKNLNESLHTDLTPANTLEVILVEEICRTSWRLRRCVIQEAALAASNDADDAAKRDLIDRTRSLYERLLHKCNAELRKLQTERQFRNEYFKKGFDVSTFGLASFQSITNDLVRQELQDTRRRLNEIDIIATAPNPCPTPVPAPTKPELASFCKKPVQPELASFCEKPQQPESASNCKTPQTPRNALCHCNSGLKFKRCCGKNAPPVLHAA